MAQKLQPPRPFVILTQNGRISLDFAATKKFKKSFFMKKIFQLGCVFYIIALGGKIFELSSKTRYFLRSLGPIRYRFYLMGPKLLGKYRVFRNNSKTIQARAKM